MRVEKLLLDAVPAESPLAIGSRKHYEEDRPVKTSQICSDPTTTPFRDPKFYGSNYEPLNALALVRLYLQLSLPLASEQ